MNVWKGPTTAVAAAPSPGFFVLSGAVYGIAKERNVWSVVKGSGAGGVAAILARKLPSGVLVVCLPLLRQALQGTPSSLAAEAAKVAGSVAVYAAATSLAQGVVLPAVIFGAGSYTVDTAVDLVQEMVRAGVWTKSRAKL